MTESFDREVLETFLENQEQLFPEPVALTEDEARDFLTDCMAVVCEDLAEVREYLDESGMDVTGLSDEEILAQDEIFAIEDGRYLVVEG